MNGGTGGKSCRVLGDFGDTFYSISSCLYGIGNNPNWCLVRLDGRCVMHFEYLSNDGLTISGNRFRRVQDVDMKHDFAFVEFNNPRDADDARYSLNGRELNGSRLIVEFAKGVPRGPGGSREYVGRGPPPGSGRCFNCGLDGHWARDCKAGDWKNKCYRCGERGHIEKNCQISPKKLKRDRSSSRSPVRSRFPRRRRNRSPNYTRRRSYSSSRSPPKKGRERRARSPRYSRSPSWSPEQHDSPPPAKARKHSPTPDEDGVGPSPKIEKAGYSVSPQRAKSRSPSSPRRDSLSGERYGCPSEANGRSRSPSPGGYEQSPVDDDGPVFEGSPADGNEEFQRPADNGKEDQHPADDDREDQRPADEDEGHQRGSESP